MTGPDKTEPTSKYDRCPVRSAVYVTNSAWFIPQLAEQQQIWTTNMTAYDKKYDNKYDNNMTDNPSDQPFTWPTAPDLFPN